MWLIRNIIFYFTNFVVFQFSCANYLNQFETWYSREIFLGAAGLLLLVVLFKIKNKWTGINTLVKNADKFNLQYRVPLNPQFIKWTQLFYGIEVIISLVFPALYLFFDTLTWPFALVLGINGFEGLIYLYRNKSRSNFLLGMNENAIVHNARGVYVLPFQHLKSIEYKYEDFFFIYEDGETLTLPGNVVAMADMPELKRRIVEMAEKKGIFYSDKLKV